MMTISGVVIAIEFYLTHLQLPISN